MLVSRIPIDDASRFLVYRGQFYPWFCTATLGVDFWVTTTPAANTAVGVANATGATDAAVSIFAPLLNNYVDVVGHATPMPFWTTGFIQCKDRYRNQTQLLDVARGCVCVNDLCVCLHMYLWLCG